MVPHWIYFLVYDADTSKQIANLTFPGNAKDRRRSLRARINQMVQQGAVTVSKYTYKKGDPGYKAKMIWTRNYPAT